MRQQFSVIRQTVLLLVSSCLILIGGWIFLAMLGTFLGLYFAVFLDVGTLQALYLVIVLAYASYFAFSTGLAAELVRVIRGRLIESTRGSRAGNLATPTTIARFDYKLDDPGDPDAFDEFLDTPLIVAGKQYIMSPAEYAETFLLQLSAELQAKYDSKLLVDTKVTRGSLDISVVFTVVVTLVQLYASGHDIFESTADYKQHLSNLFDKINGEYRNKSNRTAKISGGVEVTPRPDSPNNSGSDNSAPSALSSPQLGQPVSVTNSYTPPQSERNVNVSLNLAGRGAGVGGCVNSCLLLVLVVVIGVTSFILLFVDYNGRMQLLDEILYETSNLVRSLGESLVSFASNLYPH